MQFPHPVFLSLHPFPLPTALRSSHKGPSTPSQVHTHSPSQTPGGPPQVQRLSLWSACRFRSIERRIRASSRSCSLRSKTGKKRDSLTELSLRRRVDGDEAGSSMATNSPIRLWLSLSPCSSSSYACVQNDEGLAFCFCLSLPCSQWLSLCISTLPGDYVPKRAYSQTEERTAITPPTPSPISGWHKWWAHAHRVL